MGWMSYLGVAILTALLSLVGAGCVAALAVEHRVRVEGKVIGVSVVESPWYVSVSMDAPDGDPKVMTAIAARIDAALATGKYDALFVLPEKK